jgi:hypothetical protein
MILAQRRDNLKSHKQFNREVPLSNVYRFQSHDRKHFNLDNSVKTTNLTKFESVDRLYLNLPISNITKIHSIRPTYEYNRTPASARTSKAATTNETKPNQTKPNHFGFLDRSRYFSIQVAPQLS